MAIAREYLDRRWTALILLCVAQFVVVLDASIVNVALPSIGRGLDFSEENLPWVVNAYVIAFGGFLLLGGWAAHLLGPPPNLHGRAAGRGGCVARRRVLRQSGTADRSPGRTGA